MTGTIVVTGCPEDLLGELEPICDAHDLRLAHRAPPEEATAFVIGPHEPNAVAALQRLTRFHPHAAAVVIVPDDETDRFRTAIMVTPYVPKALNWRPVNDVNIRWISHCIKAAMKKRHHASLRQRARHDLEARIRELL